MVGQKFGNADPDMASRVGRKAKTKEIDDMPKLSPSTRTPYTGVVGGPANMPGNPSQKKSGPRGAPRNTEVHQFAEGGKIAPYEPGGFRNKAMEHKRG